MTSTTQDPVNLLVDTLARALGQIAVQSSRNDLEQSKESTSVEQLKKLTSRQTYGQQSLPTFDGDPTQWPSFTELVRTSTHECGFSNAENMGRLRKCLKRQSPSGSTVHAECPRELFGSSRHSRGPLRSSESGDRMHD